MKDRLSIRSGLGAFTLVEMLTAIAVFSILIALLAQMINSMGQVMLASHKLLNMDDQVRLIFGRMASDFAGMPQRNDVDFIFSREGNPAVGTTAGDDKIFFYSVAAGVNPYVSANENNTATLVGYCIAADAQSTPINTALTGTYLQDLHRLGRGLSWDTQQAADSDNMVFLTYAANRAPNSSSTLDGHWSASSASKTIGPFNAAAFSISSYIPPPGAGVPSNAPPTDQDYHVVGDQVIRFEYCFLLNDGTYSNYPAKNFTITVNGTTYVSNVNNLSATPLVPPGLNDDSAGNSSTGSKFCIGSRWFDCSAGRAYICTNASAGAAVWSALGTQDIAAIVVAVVLVDQDSRKLVTSVTGWQSLPRQFSDPTDANLAANPPVLMQQKWQGQLNTLLSNGLANVPPTLLARTRIFQRYFYLNTSNL